jgi:hypothetical protein
MWCHEHPISITDIGNKDHKQEWCEELVICLIPLGIVTWKHSFHRLRIPTQIGVQTPMGDMLWSCNMFYHHHKNLHIKTLTL